MEPLPCPRAQQSCHPAPIPIRTNLASPTAPGQAHTILPGEHPLITIATWDLENIFQPGSDAGPESAAAYEAKLAVLAETITELAAMS